MAVMAATLSNYAALIQRQLKQLRDGNVEQLRAKRTVNGQTGNTIAEVTKQTNILSASLNRLPFLDIKHKNYLRGLSRRLNKIFLKRA